MNAHLTQLLHLWLCIDRKTYTSWRLYDSML